MLVPDLAGAVLCGGGSRRMGEDKALLDWRGEPLVVRAARRLAEVAEPVLLAAGGDGARARRLAEVAEPVLLAAGGDGARRLARLAATPLAVADALADAARLAATPLAVADAVADAGPLAGIVAALEASPRPLLAVVAVDMPDLSPALLAAMAGLAPAIDVVLPVDDDGDQPLHAVYATSALPALREALDAGRLSVRGALANLRVERWHRDRWGTLAAPGFARNLNRPADLGSGR